jgi:hypothetical protein
MAIRRQITIDDARMEPKAHTFNDLINSKRLVWNSFIDNLLSDLNTIPAVFEQIQTIPGFIINVDEYERTHNMNNLFRYEDSQKMMYNLGGSCYMSYDVMIQKLNTLAGNAGYVSLVNDIPRTHDWDVSIKMKDRTNFIEVERLIETYFATKVHAFYPQIATNNYLDNFANISDNALLERGEDLIEVINNKIELTKSVKARKYINFRLNLVANIPNVGFKKNHIVEFIFWFIKPPQTITKTVKILVNNITHYCILPIELIKANLIAIINRSVNPGKYAKCRQDYFRLTALLTRLRTIHQYDALALLYRDINYIDDFIVKIREYVPQCYIDMDASTFVDVTANIKALPERGDKVKKLLNIYYDYYITKYELENDINRVYIPQPVEAQAQAQAEAQAEAEAQTESEPQTPSQIHLRGPGREREQQQRELREIDNYFEGGGKNYKNLYLKYKQKYKSLKNQK